jgi:formylglycine-generating enzyme required for sulfatase activity
MNLKTIFLFVLVSVIFSFMTVTSGGSPVASEIVKTHRDPFISYLQAITGSEITLKMNPVKGGVFKMGSNGYNDDEKPEHKVSVNDFWMGAFEITWDQYELFLERQIDTFGLIDSDTEVTLDIDAIASATTPYVDMSHGMGKKGYPVVNITQYAALTFCKWLSAKTGKFYRLPTEAEWEYAARAGSTSAFYFGDDTTQLNLYAWYDHNSKGKYQKVGQKQPNKNGLYDMHGNVAEWTMDQYAADTYINRLQKTTDNPWVKPTKLYPRSVRGGSWMDSALALRSSARVGSSPVWKRIDPQIPKSRWWFTNAPHIGFRIVRPKETPSKEEIEAYWLAAIDDY